MAQWGLRGQSGTSWGWQVGQKEAARWVSGLVVGGGPQSPAVFPQLYGRLYRVVEPKRIRMNAALAQLQEKQAALAEAQEKLREVSFALLFLNRVPLSVAGSITMLPHLILPSSAILRYRTVSLLHVLVRSV